MRTFKAKGYLCNMHKAKGGILYNTFKAVYTLYRSLGLRYSLRLRLRTVYLTTLLKLFINTFKVVYTLHRSLRLRLRAVYFIILLKQYIYYIIV